MRMPATSTSTATWSARWSACSPSAAKGLSGTGPKAGGPLYLLRLLAQRPDDAAALALQLSGAEAAPLRGVARPHAPGDGAPLQALREWAAAQGRDSLVAACAALRGARAGRVRCAR